MVLPWQQANACRLDALSQAASSVRACGIMTVVASRYARVANDLYQTEPWATQVLNRFFPVAGLTIWEPAAGNHLMADVLRECGALVTTSDIAVYDRPHDLMFDFLNDPRPVVCNVDGVIMNPPYGQQNRDAVRFARLALQRCRGLVALLLTAKFDFGNTRFDLFRDNPRFAAKIALTDRLSWTLDGETGTEDHAIYVWRGIDQPTAPPVLLYGGKNG